jgi:hypothetical protein
MFTNEEFEDPKGVFRIRQSKKNIQQWPKELEEDAQWDEPVSLTFHSVLKKLYTEPAIGASYQISVHFATRFQRRSFL